MERAIESIFSNPEQTAQCLIESVTAGINSKCQTVDEAKELAMKLSEEAAKFNDILQKISNTSAQISSGDMTKEEGIKIITPLVSELKQSCTALKISNADTCDSNDITEEEIAILREVIVAAKVAAENRASELASNPENPIYDTDPDLAEEGLLDGLFKPKYFSEIKKSTEAKSADILQKNAISMYKKGAKDKAIEYMSKAIKLYEGIINNLNNKFSVETTRTSTRTDPAYGTSVSDVYKTTATDNVGAARTITYFEKKIDTCNAYLLKWKNQEDKKSIKELKNNMKNGSYVTESYNITDAFEFVDALESYIADLEDELAAESAMESFGYSAATESLNIGAKIKAAFAKLKGSKTPEEVAEAKEELDESLNELSQAADEAETEEEKKQLSKAAKIGIAAAATAATIGGAIAVGHKLGEKSLAEGKDLKGAVKLLHTAGNEVGKAKLKVVNSKVGKGVGHARDAVSYGNVKMKNAITNKINGNREKQLARANNFASWNEARKAANAQASTDAWGYDEDLFDNFEW